MRISELRAALAERRLSIVGTKETLEARLQNSINLEMGLEDRSASTIPDYAKPMGSNFAFGETPKLDAEVNMEVIEEVAMETGNEGLQYPPQRDFLPFCENKIRSATNQPRLPQRNLQARLGKGSVISRLGPINNRVSVFDRITSNEAEVDAKEAERKVTRVARFKPHRQQISAPKLVDVYQEYDIDKMKDRANKYSDVPCLKRRARRFDEETANELVQIKEARAKNERFKRFKLGDATSSSEDEED